MPDDVFQHIVVVDPTGLVPWAIDALGELSARPPRVFEDLPTSAEETLRRIGDADCVLVSWNTPLDASVLSRCEALSYVGMCCSLYSTATANVDVAFAEANGISVEGVRDYGDEGVLEFVVAELVRLLKGLGEHQWRDEPVELTGRKVGIVGMGSVGQRLARRLQAFGAEIFYFNRSRKEQAERDNVQYLPLDRLLETVDIVSTHLPKNTTLLGDAAFQKLGNGKILVNTSLGVPFHQEPFARWLDQPGNFSILDGDGAVGLAESLRAHPRVLYSPAVAGWTAEAKERLSSKVLANVRNHLRERRKQEGS